MNECQEIDSLNERISLVNDEINFHEALSKAQDESNTLLHKMNAQLKDLMTNLSREAAETYKNSIVNETRFRYHRNNLMTKINDEQNEQRKLGYKLASKQLALNQIQRSISLIENKKTMELQAVSDTYDLLLPKVNSAELECKQLERYNKKIFKHLICSSRKMLEVSQSETETSTTYLDNNRYIFRAAKIN